MTDRQLRDEAMTLFLAGHDTTALTLSWGWYLLAQHPDAYDALQAELAAALGGRPPTPADLPRLPYTERVVLEIMRLYPAAYMMGRQAVAACELGGYRLPAGATVLMSQWIMHRDPRWFDDPETLPPRPLGRRPGPAPAEVRLLPLRRRPAPVHRQLFRHDGGDAGAGRPRPALPIQPRSRTADPPGPRHHAEAGAWHPGGRSSPCLPGRRVTHYPHRIRLRGPWECEPLERLPSGAAPPGPLRMTLPCRWADGGLKDFSGRALFRRRFGYPGQIDAYERVWLTLAGVSDRAAIRLNGTALGNCGGDGPFEFEITRLLRPRNELVVEVDGTALEGGLWGETALEVRCTAYLCEVRVWVESDELHAAGLVVGEAERPLDLYVLSDGATAAYTTITAAPQGTPFHIIADKSPAPALGKKDGPKSESPTAQVDLVNGAVVWYTMTLEIAIG